MTGFDQLVGGFAVALSWKGLLYCFIGCLWGTIVGVLPGLGPLAGMTLLLPLTFGLDPTLGIIMLTGIFYGAMYGGSTTSILVRIPGEAASVVTCIDGYEMARQGRAGPALMIAAVGSFVGGTVSILGLMLITPPLASPTWPKVKRGMPVRLSRPIVPMANPSSTMAAVFARGPADPAVTTPSASRISTTSTGGPIAIMTFAKGGAMNMRPRIETVPPTKLPSAAMVRAGPARPLRAIS
jgi:hypothetical protein